MKHTRVWKKERWSLFLVAKDQEWQRLLSNLLSKTETEISCHNVLCTRGFQGVSVEWINGIVLVERQTWPTMSGYQAETTPHRGFPIFYWLFLKTVWQAAIPWPQAPSGATRHRSPCLACRLNQNWNLGLPCGTSLWRMVSMWQVPPQRSLPGSSSFLITIPSCPGIVCIMN